MPYQPSAAKLVLVEGNEEKVLFEHVCGHLGLAGIEIKDYGGKGKLAPFLKGLTLGREFRTIVRSLAITRDADASASSAFQSVSDACKRAGLKPPPTVGAVGDGRPAVRIHILPGGSRPGAPEDVCLESIADQPIMKCVNELLECVESVGAPIPRNVAKARVYAFLAVQEKPGRRIAETAGSGTWPFESPAFAPIRKLLTAM